MGKKFGVIIASLGAIILIVVSAIGGGLIWHVGSEIEQTQLSAETLGYQTLHEFESLNQSNIALFGVDTSRETLVTSEFVAILTINHTTKNVSITPLLSDLTIDIPQTGHDKLSHAYAFGGPQLAVETLNQNLDLNIGHYITIDLAQIPQFIDELGGIEVEIDELERLQLQAVSVQTSGVMTLTGEQAVAYSLLPAVSLNELADRRQEVLQVLVNQIERDQLTSSLNFLNVGLPAIETNLSVTELLTLTTQLLPATIQVQATQPALRDVTQIIDPASGVWLLQADLEQLKASFR